MKKGIALIAMLLAMALMLTGCNLVGYDAELDGARVVAKVNDTELTKAEWLAYRDYLASYYQQYMQQYFGMNMPMTEEDVAAYGESAMEQMIESVVLQDKMVELGLDVLSEEDAAEIESYADSMVDFYKMMVRYQNYPGLETVEEEAERLAKAAESAEEGAEAEEPKATVTNAQLDEMLVNDLNTIGYTREYFVENETASRQADSIREYAAKDVAVSDEEVKAEFDSRVAAQKESYDANPAGYAQAEINGRTNYYAPAGYRGVKSLLVKLAADKQTEINELTGAVNTAQNTLDDAQKQLDELNAQDTAKYDEETLAAHSEQIAALEETVATAQADVTENQAKLEEVTEAAFAEILPIAEEALAKAQAGEDFDGLIEAYGKDSGMTAEPNKSRGYLVAEGLNVYEPAFQEAAMALANVGDVSEPVRTSYGYHILQYAGDVAEGEVEFTEEVSSEIYDELLAGAKDAAYEAALTQWVSEAKVTTYPKVMK